MPSLVNFVGARFLKEIVDDLFPDHSIISPSVRREVKVKYDYGVDPDDHQRPVAQHVP